MSRTVTNTALGQLPDGNFIQENPIARQLEYSSGRYIAPITNDDSGQYMGESQLTGKSYYDNGLSYGYPYPMVTQNTPHNQTGMGYDDEDVYDNKYDDMYDDNGVEEHMLKNDGIYSLYDRAHRHLSHRNIPETYIHNLTGMSNKALLGVSNDELYGYPRGTAPVGSAQYEIDMARGKYTTLSAGIVENGGLVR